MHVGGLEGRAGYNGGGSLWRVVWAWTSTPSLSKWLLVSLLEKQIWLNIYKYINIYITKLISLDRYLNLVFYKFIY
jgi:hypothetical protein